MADGGECTTACVPMPSTRNWVLIDQLDSTRARPGAKVQVKWDGLEERDSRGYYAHLRGLKICGSVNLDIPGATNDAVAAYTLRGLFSDIRLTDAMAHEYLLSLDGRSIVDDYFRRHMRLPYPLDGAIGANLGAGAINRQIDLEFSLSIRTPGGNPLERLLSAGALKQKGSQAFNFRLANTGGTIPGLVASGGFAAGIDVVSYERDDGDEGLDIYGDVVYLRDPVADAKWYVREYEINEINSALKYSDKHEYAIARHFIEDDNNGGVTGQQEAGLITNLTVKCGGDLAVDALILSEMRRRDLELARSFPDSAVALGLANLGEPTDTGVTDPSRVFLPWRAREFAPAGTVTFKMTRAGNFTRFLHAGVACDDADRSAQLKAVLGCRSADCFQIIGGQMVPGVQDPTMPKILTNLK